MKTISFESDYIAGAHPKVLEALAATNMESLPGYGTDPYCAAARDKIRAALGCDKAQVEFLVGGTQVNAVALSTLLKDYEGVITPATGHIASHEAGAIEFTGHEVIELPQHLGKLAAKDLTDYMEEFYADANHDHRVFPGMVYISYPTEYGTLYSYAEMDEIHKVCRKYGLLLYVDGARMGYGLMSPAADIRFEDLPDLCDVFTVGGTKVGALCGEALVFVGTEPAHFMTSMKKRGALLAKGRLLGVQFDALFTDGLYFEIGRYAAERTAELKALLEKKGLSFFLDSPTNQQFVVLRDEMLKALEVRGVRVSFWEKPDAEHTVVRFAVSWSTAPEDIRALEEILDEI